MNRSAKVLILISFFFLSISSNLNLVDAGEPFFDPSSPVVVLQNKDDFKCKVLDACNVVVVQFFAPWCPPCKNLKPQFERAAKVLKGAVILAAIDADANKDIKQEYGVTGYPTVKSFIPGKPPTDWKLETFDPREITAKSLDQLKIYAAEKAANPEKKEL